MKRQSEKYYLRISNYTNHHLQKKNLPIREMPGALILQLQVVVCFMILLRIK